MTDTKSANTVPTGTTAASSADKLQYAINLAKAGRKVEARNLLRKLVAQQPANQAAWLWLSALATEKDEAKAALTQARKINAAHPGLTQAEQWLAHQFSDQPSTQETPVVSTPPDFNQSSPTSTASKNIFKSANALVFGAMISVVFAGLIALFLGLIFELNTTVQAKQSQTSTQKRSDSEIIVTQYSPVLDDALSQRDWQKAITILEEFHRLDPASIEYQLQLADVYFERGLTLRHKGIIENALVDFEQTLALDNQHNEAQQEKEVAQDYLTGVAYYQDGEWDKAIELLEAVQIADPDYTNVKDLLFSAYYNQGLALKAANKLTRAKNSFEAAVTLRPDLNEPYLQLAEVDFALAPHTPLPIPTPEPVKDRIIVVGVAEQQMLVYEEDEIVFDFVISTGEPGKDTAVGDFEILDKIDVAYASTWNLDMPYWMGIYWSGPLENGIHALPIVKHTGYKLWDGFLGQRVSYGCIILSDEDAATLFDWTEVGTKVKIVPSLMYWTPPE